ncbi:MAG TPA: hypothetical protein VMU19_09910 [Bryobacteraceae bacterium]|nr:hypothetical protein [Bryobacteraceae bacterium]
MGVTVGTLGVGVQAATAVTHSSNIRGGFNYFSYTGSTTSNSDNITFNGTLKLESGELLFDQYLGHTFHISPGVVLYDGNQATGNATLPAGKTFTLNNTQYYSSMANPVTGSGSFTADKIAPEVLFGFGNLLPRRANKHFSVSFEMGAIFTQKPKIGLNLAGSACTTSSTVGCADIASSSSIQNNLTAEQNKLNDQVGSYLKYWPVIRLGFGYKF